MSKRNEEEMQRIVKLKSEGRTFSQIAEEMGLTLTQVAGRWCRYNKGGRGEKVVGGPRDGRISSVPKKVTGHTLADFRAEHDLPLKIREQVAETFGKDQETYYTDQEFRELCGISVGNWRRNADQDGFKQFQFKKGNDHYWAHPDMIHAMKTITGAAGH